MSLGKYQDNWGRGSEYLFLPGVIENIHPVLLSSSSSLGPVANATDVPQP